MSAAADLEALKRCDRMARERAMQTARELKQMGAGEYFLRSAVLAARCANRALISRMRVQS